MKRTMWDRQTLVSVCDINPRGPLVHPPSRDTLVTFVPMAAVDEVTGRIAVPELRPYGEVAKGYTAFQDGDVLFAKITPCMQNGKAAVASQLRNGLGFGSTEFHVIRPGPKILSKWVFAYIRQKPFRIAAEASFTGTAGQQRVPQTFFSRALIPVPPLPEQHRIVGLLDEADELRRLREQADRRTADLIHALFYEMFGDPASNPMDWRLAPVCSFVKSLEGGRNVAPAGSDDGTARYRVLKVSAVTWGDFRPQESKPLPPEYEPPPEHVVQTGDLLFSRANTSELVGATTYVYSTPPNLILPDKLWRFVWAGPATVEPLYVWWLFRTYAVRRELSARATGTGGSMKNISKPKLLTLRVPVPPLPLQRQFAAHVAGIRALEGRQAESRRRLDDLFQSMLHRAFRGEL